MVELLINQQQCIRCLRCVTVCPARIFTQQESGDIEGVNLKSCIECGHCVAICPEEAIQHSSFPAGSILELQSERLPTPDSLLELMRKRRSNRAFSKRPIPMEYLDRILEAANLAPTAKNGRPLKYTLVTNPEVLRSVHQTCIGIADEVYARLSSSEDRELRLKALYFKKLGDVYRRGYEIILREATAIILIHSTNIADTADANLAYQNASLMAESLDVAHFFTGYLRLLTMQDNEDTLQKLLGIEGHILSGMALGMPKLKFNKYVVKDDLQVNKIL